MVMVGNTDTNKSSSNKCNGSNKSSNKCNDSSKSSDKCNGIIKSSNKCSGRVVISVVVAVRVVEVDRGMKTDFFTPKLGAVVIASPTQQSL